MRYSTLTAGFAALAVGLLAGCSGRTDVSLTGNTPAQYSHVWITTQEVWFNQSATAGPDDAGWTKFPLSNPSTVDVVQDAGGTLGSITSRLRLLPGTYSQIRLIPLDSSAALATAAADAGAIYNAEADYEDSAGTTHQVPLELLNPDKGIAMVGSLHIAVGSLASAAAVTTALGTPTTGTTTGTTPATTGTGTTTGGATTTAVTTSFALSLDGARDLVPFTFGTTASPVNGILLSSHAGAYNLDNAGGISGTLTLTSLTGYTSVSGLPDIQATAEALSADGSRHVAVLSTPVHSDGTFLLYPLPSSTSTAASYDVVIHGAGIATIIIKAVTIPLSTSSSSATGAATTTTTPTTATATTPATTTGTATTATTTTATTTAASTNTVSIGTFIPRAATAYAANIATTAASPLTADAQVGFYQTLSASGEVPYQIEAAPIDPFNQVLAAPLHLSVGTIDSGTYVATGDTIALFSSAPTQGAGNYAVAASAPGFGDGALTPTVSSATPTVTLGALSVSSGSSLGALQVVVTPASPGTFDAGELLVSRNGTLVSRVSLGGVVASGGPVTVAVPAATSSAKYYVSVRVWNSSDPAGTLQRQWFPNLVDMSGGANGSIALTIN
jgi:Domain of unknown function (DUF4382)